MSIRNPLKSALLAVTAAATLLLALPSQAGDHHDRDGSRAAYGWQAGDRRDGHRRGDDRRDHRQDHRRAHYRYSQRHFGYHGDYHRGYHDSWRGNHRDDHRRHDDWRHRDHRGYR